MIFFFFLLFVFFNLGMQWSKEEFVQDAFCFGQILARRHLSGFQSSVDQ